MAAVSQTIIPQPHNKPFTGFKDLVPAYTAPRSCVEFNLASNSVPTGVITAKGAGDTNILRINCVLPRGFAYVMSYATATLFGADQEDIDNWQDQAAIVHNFSTIGPGGNMSGLTANGSMNSLSTLFIKTYRPQNHFASPLWDEGGGTVTTEFRFSDNDGTNATAAGTILFFACFLQYDIVQALDTGINAPQAVRIT